MNFEKLKKLTKPFHDLLEIHAASVPLFSENATCEDYYQFLKIQYVVYSELEEKIEALASSEHDIAYSSRVQSIKQELESLNIALPEQVVVPFCLDENEILFALAALYLLEGSRHGAFMILAKVREFMPHNYRFYFLETNKEEFFTNWGNLLKIIGSLVSTQELENKFIVNVCQLYLEIGTIYDRFASDASAHLK